MVKMLRVVGGRFKGCALLLDACQLRQHMIPPCWTQNLYLENISPPSPATGPGPAGHAAQLPGGATRTATFLPRCRPSLLGTEQIF